MRIDAHHHLWDLAVREQPWAECAPVLHRSFLPDELGALLDHVGIDGAIVVQTGADVAETGELLDFCAVAPFLVGVVGWVDLAAPDIGNCLASFAEHPQGDALVGARHPVQSEMDPRWLCNPDVRRGLAALGSVGLTYDLVVTTEQLPSVRETVAAVTETRFVLDHAGNPDIASHEREPWLTHLQELAELPNIAVKLSGLVTLADHAAWSEADLQPYSDAVLDLFGADRVMFGSDWPVCLLAASYERVVDAASKLLQSLSTGDRDRVLGGSAHAWYRLGKGSSR